MKRQSAKNISSNENQRLLVAYYATVTLLIFGAFLGGSRAWGFNAFAYLPLPLWLTLTAVLAIIPPALNRWTSLSSTFSDVANESKPRPIWGIFGIFSITLLAGLLFYVMRGTTHFLGDGYSLLANLAKFVPYQKFSELGTDMVVQWVARLLDVTNFQLAERSYQIISIGSGMIFVAAVVWFALALFNRRIDRVLFTLLVLSGGQILLFFGYVENYAPLALASALFVLTGFCAARGRCHRFAILLPLALAIFFHLLAIVLIPAAVYLLMRDTGLGRRFGNISLAARWGAVVFVGIVAFSCILISGDRVLFLRLAVVPFVVGVYTVRGYTLLSVNHLLDFVNLVIVLCPGLLICLSAIKTRTAKSLSPRAEFVFVGIVSLCTLCAAFVLDPKLGMARDWDLLSLPAFPLTIFAALVLLERNDQIGRTSILLAGLVGVTVLCSRAAVQYLPDRGAAYAEDLMKLDLARSRNAFTSLIDYYASVGDQTRSTQIKNYWQGAYPEVAALRQVSTLFASGQLPQAKQMLDAVIARSPEYAEAWAGLCIYYYRTKQYDSALVAAQIADGLNPNNPAVLFNMGLAEYSRGNPTVAEKLWLKSVKIDSSFAALSVAHLYRDRGDSAQYATYLFSAASRPGARAEDLKEAIELGIRLRQFDRASLFLTRFEATGVDSSWADSMRGQYPDLK